MAIHWGKAALKPGERRGGKALTSQEFERLCREARILARKHGRPSVLLRAGPAGSPLVTKVWYPKRGWSSDRIWPYSERFLRNAHALTARGIHAPVPQDAGRVADTDIRYVTYEWLDGADLRTLTPAVPRRELAVFVATLHAQGVYCRALHLGNVLALRDGGFALLDVTDTRLLDRPLPLGMRARNLGILCSNPMDLDYMQDGNWSELVMEYCRAAGMSVTQTASMRERVRLQMARRGERHGRRRTRPGRPGIGAALFSGPFWDRER